MRVFAPVLVSGAVRRRLERVEVERRHSPALVEIDHAAGLCSMALRPAACPPTFGINVAAVAAGATCATSPEFTPVRRPAGLLFVPRAFGSVLVRVIMTGFDSTQDS
jgi:hypothetical protein